MRMLRKAVFAAVLMGVLASQAHAITINGQEYPNFLTLKEAICEFFGFAPDQCNNM